jgi:biopolymer transport protein ExbD/biopolymer transport protein TolR
MLHDIPLTPLIDTALTLLVIFMIAAPMMHNVIKVTLPRGAAQEGTGLTQELIVYIDAHNQIYWDSKNITVADLIATLQKLCDTKQNQVVFVKADEKASYGTVLELVDKIKVVSGIQHVALATQKMGTL